MSDVQDFLNEMGVHNYDRNDAVPIKAEELQDGEYIVKIKSLDRLNSLVLKLLTRLQNILSTRGCNNNFGSGWKTTI